MKVSNDDFVVKFDSSVYNYDKVVYYFQINFLTTNHNALCAITSAL